MKVKATIAQIGLRLLAVLAVTNATTNVPGLLRKGRKTCTGTTQRPQLGPI